MFKRVCPRTKTSPVRALGDLRGRLGEFRPSRLPAVMLPKGHNICVEAFVGNIDLIGNIKASRSDGAIPGTKPLQRS